MQRRQAGFTMIELVITIVVVGILAALAIPGFSAWIQNQQIRTGTEGVLNGLQTARAEAVKRNQLVEFRLGDRTAWEVVLRTTNETLQSRAADEGSRTAVTAIQPDGATTVTFNGMGWVVANEDGSPTISQVDVRSSVLKGTEARPLRVVLTSGGSTKMCDPQVANDDPRACP